MRGCQIRTSPRRGQLQAPTGLLGAVALACGDTTGAGTGETTGMANSASSISSISSTSSTMNEPQPTTGGTGGSDSTGEASTTGGSSGEVETCGFICDSTGGPDHCDVYTQDCPQGEKCAPYAEGGGSSWNALKCVPVLGVGRPGDPCTTAPGGVSGIDDCEEGAMCWDVDKMNHGVCVEMCGGSESKPVCEDEEKFNCATNSEGVLNLCLPDCDPLVQNCPGADLCIPVGDVFICVDDASGEGAQLFGLCEFANACDKGLLCVTPSAAKECDPNAGGCCMPFCDLSNPDAVCPGVGTICLSLYAEGQAPPDLQNVGICVLPE